MNNTTKKLTRAEATIEMEQWKERALLAKEILESIVKYHNTRTAPLQFAQTKKFVEKCKEAGVQLNVFIGSDPLVGVVSTSIIAVDSDTAQSILDTDLDGYRLIDFISEDMVLPWMKKVVDLDDLSSLKSDGKEEAQENL